MVRISPISDFSDTDPFDAAIKEVDILYRQKIAGLRRLPRHEKPHALRAARTSRQMALKALRDKRSAERHAKRGLRRLNAPTPR